MADWAFSLRTRLGPSLDDSDDEDDHQDSGPTAVNADVEDAAVSYKPNPFSIARINANARTLHQPMAPRSPARQELSLTKNVKPVGLKQTTLPRAVVSSHRNAPQKAQGPVTQSHPATPTKAHVPNVKPGPSQLFPRSINAPTPFAPPKLPTTPVKFQTLVMPKENNATSNMARYSSLATPHFHSSPLRPSRTAYSAMLSASRSSPPDFPGSYPTTTRQTLLPSIFARNPKRFMPKQPFRPALRPPSSSAQLTNTPPTAFQQNEVSQVYQSPYPHTETRRNNLVLQPSSSPLPPSSPSPQETTLGKRKLKSVDAYNQRDEDEEWSTLPSKKKAKTDNVTRSTKFSLPGLFRPKQSHGAVMKPPTPRVITFLPPPRLPKQATTSDLDAHSNPMNCPSSPDSSSDPSSGTDLSSSAISTHESSTNASFDIEGVAARYPGIRTWIRDRHKQANIHDLLGIESCGVVFRDGEGKGDDDEIGIMEWGRLGDGD